MAEESVRYLSRADVEAVGLTGGEVIEILGAAFRAKRDGAVEMPPKIGVHPRDDAFIHAMPAYLASADAVGIKWVAGYPDNQQLGLPYIHGLFLLSDAATGRPLAVMDATWITEVRTAAASMLGIRALAERPVEAVGIIGCGRQGHVHLELAREVLPDAAPRHAVRPPPRAGGGARRRAPGAGGPGRRFGAGDRRRLRRRDHHRRDRPRPRAPAPARAPRRRDRRLRGRLRREPVRGPLRGRGAVRRGRRGPVPLLPRAGLLRRLPRRPGRALRRARRGRRPAPGLRVFVPLGLALEDVAVAAEVGRRASETGLGTALPL